MLMFNKFLDGPPREYIELSSSNPLASKVVALVLPGQGYAFVNGVVQQFNLGPVTNRDKFGCYWYAGTSGQYLKLGPVRNVTTQQRFSLFSTWLSDDSQYQSADFSRYVISCRTAGNLGWAWGRRGAIGGGAGGNVTQQTLVLQGVAAYFESGYNIPSIIETSVGTTVSGTTWKTYKDGIYQESIAIGTMSAGGDLYFGAQGPIPIVAGTEWVDRIGITAVFDDVLSNEEMASLHNNPWQLFNSRNVKVPGASGIFPTGPRIHYVVYPSSETRFPQQDDVVKGWPGVATTSGYEKAPTGSQDFTFAADASALAELTTYKIAYCWYDGLNYSPVEQTTFTTLTAGIPGVPTLSAVTLYNVTTTTARPRVTITF